MATTLSEVTRLLQAWSDGDTEARDQLIPLVFDELHTMARRYFQGERADHLLQPTALVNEMYVRLFDQHPQMRHRRDFFAIAANIIRRVLVDHARSREALKRGREVVVIPLDETLAIPAERNPGLLALHDALNDLNKHDPRGSRVVELHVFGGFEFTEIAEIEGISRNTALRDWDHAKLWLRRQLSRE